MSPPEASTAATTNGRPRRTWGIVGGVVGLLAAVAVGWWTFRNESERITATTTAYVIESDTSVTVSFDVSRPPGLAVTCTVRALDGRFTVVGSTDVAVPAEGDRVVSLRKAVRTTSRAVTGVVQDCVRT